MVARNYFTTYFPLQDRTFLNIININIYSVHSTIILYKINKKYLIINLYLGDYLYMIYFLLVFTIIYSLQKELPYKINLFFKAFNLAFLLVYTLIF